MHCLDCVSSGDAGDAVAVCHMCGAAVCERHAAIVAVHLVRTGAILREEPVEPPAREVLCLVCSAARSALATTRRTAGRRAAARPDEPSAPAPVPSRSHRFVRSA